MDHQALRAGRPIFQGVAMFIMAGAMVSFGLRIRSVLGTRPINDATAQKLLAGLFIVLAIFAVVIALNGVLIFGTGLLILTGKEDTTAFRTVVFMGKIISCFYSLIFSAAFISFAVFWGVGYYKQEGNLLLSVVLPGIFTLFGLLFIGTGIKSIIHIFKTS